MHEPVDGAQEPAERRRSEGAPPSADLFHGVPNPRLDPPNGAGRSTQSACESFSTTTGSVGG
ncbi:hypothetical protein HMPREF0972_01375 [Actinomyces sp. oral taxon 848 str. F0332]|nr:hypothetical protein HMPREF0972_01375 [Actinomyces sp. oral taxon 848 str. F0332]